MRPLGLVAVWVSIPNADARPFLQRDQLTANSNALPPRSIPVALRCDNLGRPFRSIVGYASVWLHDSELNVELNG